MRKRKRRKPMSKGKTKKRRIFTPHVSRRVRREQKKVVTIPCTACEDGILDMENDLKRRPIDGVNVDYVIAYGDITKTITPVDIFELGFLCPSCDNWDHVFADDEYVRALREDFNAANQTAIMGARRRDYDHLVRLAEAAEAEYKAAFTAFNDMMRDVAGYVSVAAGNRNFEEEE